VAQGALAVRDEQLEKWGSSDAFHSVIETANAHPSEGQLKTVVAAALRDPAYRHAIQADHAATAGFAVSRRLGGAAAAAIGVAALLVAVQALQQK
jgi:hypothetical protein